MSKNHPRTAFGTLVLLIAMVATGIPHHARGDQMNELVENILAEVVHSAMSRAREEINRYTNIDLAKRGYRRGANEYASPRKDDDESWRELDALAAEHDREAVSLEKELYRKLDKSQAEFEREASKEDKPGKIREKREKLAEQVDHAYAVFEEKLAELNARFDEKREHILAQERGREREKDRTGGLIL